MYYFLVTIIYMELYLVIIPVFGVIMLAYIFYNLFKEIP